MPYTKEERREYMKKYRQENKKYVENQKQKQKEYYEENKNKISESKKEYQKEYRKTEKGRKVTIIAKWKSKGIISNDYDSLYDYYLNCNNCEECNVELIIGSGFSNHKHLDHDHNTGLFRNVLCGSCNIKKK